jgi:hypothetical protein
MEEILQLRAFLEQQRYDEALALVAEMEEMSSEDKINKIRNVAIVLLLHLIKQEAEQRTTRSWDLSIYNALYQISYTNRRRKAGGTYLDAAMMQSILAEAYRPAIKRAALEACEGRYDEQELERMVDRAALERNALALVQAQQQEIG